MTCPWGFEKIMFIIVIAIFFIVLFITVWVTTKKFIRKRILGSNLKDISKNCNMIITAAHSFPEELNNYLAPQLKNVTNIITKTEKHLEHISRHLNDSQEFFEQSKKDVVDIQKNINKAENLWAQYNKFRADLGYLKSTVSDLIERINSQTKTLRSQEKEYEELITKKVNDILPQLEGLVTKYNLLALAPFADFSYNLVLNVSKEYEASVDDADKLFRDLEQFDKTFQMYITRLQRKSTFYLTLNEVPSDSVTGKRFATKHDLRNSERLGESPVSYKTYKKAYTGKRYSTNIFITSKRFTSDQIITLKIIFDEDTYNFDKEVDLKVFKDILTELALPLNVKELDENGVPVDLHLTNLNIPICEKKNNDFTINYHYNLFEQLNIYDLLEPEPEAINVNNLDNEVILTEDNDEEALTEESQKKDLDIPEEEPLVS